MAGLSFAPVARAEVVVAAMAPGLCLDVNQSNNRVGLYQCQSSVNQNFFTSAYGQQKLGGRCLDQETQAQGAQLVMNTCGAASSQKWSLVNDGADKGLLRNEAGWCADIFEGKARAGQKVVAYKCGSANNQRWGRGVPMTANQLGLVSLNLMTLNNLTAGSIISGNSGAIISGGAGNIISGGAGNIISGGAGNFVKLTGGAIISGGAGN